MRLSYSIGPALCIIYIRKKEEKGKVSPLKLTTTTIIINYFNSSWLILLLKYFQTVSKANAITFGRRGIFHFLLFTNSSCQTSNARTV